MKPSQSNKTLDGKIQKEFYQAFDVLQNTLEVQKFLEDLCTPAELQAMADRWRVVAMIEAQKPYRQIYEETGVSMTTIGRVARCMRFGSGGYQLVLERFKEKVKRK